MFRKILIGLIWFGFLVYTIGLNPLGRIDTWQTGGQLVTFQLDEVNSYLVAIFWMMWIWPMVYACLMFVDRQMQQVPAWPFFVGSCLLGVMGLAPYFLLRQRQPTYTGVKDRWIVWLEQRYTAIGLLAIALLLILYALTTGDWGEFVQQFRTRIPIHLITLDWLLLGLVFPLTGLFADDMARRNVQNRRVFWAIALVPLIGPLLYLCWRPPLTAKSVQRV